jgi:hypothetical protein
MSERKAVTKEVLGRYLRASKSGKGAILDELCLLTGWSRDHARRTIRQARAGPRQRKKVVRAPIYGEEVIHALERVWAIFGFLSGKRLAPFLAEGVEVLERFGEVAIEPEVRAQLVRMSAATIDRRLQPARSRQKIKGRSGTKPGTLLRHQIPIRTFADWDDAAPGFCECDLVSHEGGSAVGEFCQTLTLTCVATGWTEVRAVANKAQRHCFDALLALREQLPFPLLGIDSDNGSEFINRNLAQWCEAEAITFTRTRPYRKNDNSFVEQKNWSVVRQAAGYHRYDTPAELRTLNELYEQLRLYVNFFQPSQKLAEKTRHGARVYRRHDVARTPYRRVLASPAVSEDVKAELAALYVTLNPAQLQRDIVRCQRRLLDLAAKKKPRDYGKGVPKSDDHPWKGFRYGKDRFEARPGRYADKSGEATK